MGIICLLKPIRYLASLEARRIASFEVGDAIPKLGKMGLGGKNGPIRKCNIGFLLAPHSDRSAISKRFHRTQQRYRQTDRQV